MCRMLIYAVAFILFGATASAQIPCTQRAELLTWLAAKYKEMPVALGVNREGGLVEVLSSDKGDTWTIIVTSPVGLSCVVAVGEGWRAGPREEHLAEPQA